MLTTAPGPDVVPYHNRQVVVLRPQDWSAWLHLTKTEAELLQPLPKGSLDRDGNPEAVRRSTIANVRAIVISSPLMSTAGSPTCTPTSTVNAKR